MENIGKKAFLFKIIKVIILAVVITFLVILIQNQWDINASVIEFIDFISKVTEQVSK